jgi:serine protease Do
LATLRLAWTSLGCLALAAAFPASAGDPFLRRTAAVEVVEKVGPAVVSITTEQVVRRPNPFRSLWRDPFFERFFENFFEPTLPRTRQNLGSGVLIDAQRHVLTNEHVIARASRVQVGLSDGRQFEATPVGADPNNDLAVLRVETDEALPWVPVGSSDDLLVGEPVIAIGNPFGLSNTVTTGVLSAVDRAIRANERVYYGFLQTDASINPGNSGGPLLDAEGELIGINTAIYDGAEGIGFAIPIDAAKRVVDELIAHGVVAPVWIGLELQDVDPRLLDVMDLPANVTGALVRTVHDGTPAARAGVRRGDLITRIDGHALLSARDFYERLRHATAGQEIGLELRRGNSSLTLSVKAMEVEAEWVDLLAERLLGVKLRAGPRGGFEVASVRPGSGAARIGLHSGDWLLRIDGTPLSDGAALRRSLLDLRGRSRALIVVGRGPGRYHVTIPIS